MGMMLSRAKNGSKETRIMLASNCIIPLNVQKVLMKDREEQVRIILAENSVTETEVLQVLSKDTSSIVTSCALRRLAVRRGQDTP